MVHRDRKPMKLSLDDETRNILEEMKEEMKMPISRIIDTLVQLGKDAILDSQTTIWANIVRKKLGKKPLKNSNKFYSDIWLD